ncbi:MAG: dynamin family protein [Nocardioidaceae bacterium]|nr:dynamin family protein [Nocardioidaceae bacterium]
MSDPSTPSALIAAIVRLRQALVDTPLPFEAIDVEVARDERDKLIQQLDDYVLPRLLQSDAPLLVVVGGSTGTGKSTLVNSLVGSRVTEAGVLRPTTRSPVLVHHPDDARWFAADRLLPELERTDAKARDQGTLHLAATEDLPAGLAIVDTPDLDSVEERNRTLAGQLLATADLWLYVTSAKRYADQVPWVSLKSAAERGAAVAVVLDRTTHAAVREVSSHLARMLTARGLGDSPLFTVAQSTLDGDGLLPAHVVAPIRAWLDSLALDPAARAVVIQRTLDGAVASLGHRARAVSEALRTQERLAAELRDVVVEVYADRRASATASCFDGSLLRGELSSRWQEFVDTGELMRSVEDRAGRGLDRLPSVARLRSPSAEQLMDALGAQLSALLVEEVQSAVEQTAARWRLVDAGSAVLDAAATDVDRVASGVEARVKATLEDWQSTLLDLARAESADRHATSSFLSSGVHSVVVALMVVVLDDPQVAADRPQSTAATGRRILGGIFGHLTMQRLIDAASENLAHRIDQVWRHEQGRLFEVLGERRFSDGAAEQLLELSREVDDIRWAGAQA